MSWEELSPQRRRQAILYIRSLSPAERLRRTLGATATIRTLVEADYPPDTP